MLHGSASVPVKCLLERICAFNVDWLGTKGLEALNVMRTSRLASELKRLLALEHLLKEFGLPNRIELRVQLVYDRHKELPGVVML
jgi:hypothetical protein